MKSLIKEKTERFVRERKIYRRWLAGLMCLVLLVSSCTYTVLTRSGLASDADPDVIAEETDAAAEEQAEAEAAAQAEAEAQAAAEAEAAAQAEAEAQAAAQAEAEAQAAAEAEAAAQAEAEAQAAAQEQAASTEEPSLEDGTAQEDETVTAGTNAQEDPELTEEEIAAAKAAEAKAAKIAGFQTMTFAELSALTEEELAGLTDEERADLEALKLQKQQEELAAQAETEEETPEVEILSSEMTLEAELDGTKITAEIPAGAFKAYQTEDDEEELDESRISMEAVEFGGDDEEYTDVSDLIKEGLADETYMDDMRLYRVTFTVDGEEQEPQEVITLTVEGSGLTLYDTEDAAVFSYDADAEEESLTEIPQREQLAKELEEAGEDTSNLDDEYNTSNLSLNEDEDALETAEFEVDGSGVYGIYACGDNVLTYEDLDGVTVTVTALEDGAIPAGTTLEVKEITSVDEEYTDVEEKLNEKAEDEPYEIAGFLAYDITLIDADGNETEPGDTVSVSIEYDEAAIPEEVQKLDAETLSVTVMHLEEDEKSDDVKAADLQEADTSGEIVNIDTTSDMEINSVEFETESFSTYVVTWTISSFQFKVYYVVDEEGDNIINGNSPISNTDKSIGTDWKDVETLFDINDTELNVGTVYFSRAYLKDKEGKEIEISNIKSGSNWSSWSAYGSDTYFDAQSNKKIYYSTSDSDSKGTEWSKSDSCLYSAGSYILYMEYTKNIKIQYKVVTDTDVTGEVGGTLTSNSEFVESGNKIVGSTATANSWSTNSATGYLFYGWYRDSDCTERLTENAILDSSVIEETPTSATTYYAKFVKCKLETIGFYLNLANEVLDEDGNVTSQNTSKFTLSLAGRDTSNHENMRVAVPYDHKTHSNGDENKKWKTPLSVIADETSKKADLEIRELKAGTYGNQDGQEEIKYQIVEKDDEGYYVGAFPTDDEILGYLKENWSNDEKITGRNNGKKITMNGIEIDENYLNSDNFACRWYVFKDEDSDYWHIDGVLVAKSGLLYVQKTFDNAEAAGEVEENFEITVKGKFLESGEVGSDGKTVDNETVVTLTLKNDSSMVAPNKVENDDGTVTYSWMLLVYDFTYTIEETGYDDAGDDAEWKYVSTEYSYVKNYEKSEDEAETEEESSTVRGVTTQAKIDSKTDWDDETNRAIQTFTFINHYAKETNILLKKISANDNSDTPVLLEGAEFTLYKVTSPSTENENEGEEGAESSEEVVGSNITTNENAANELSNLSNGIYKLVETKAPDGYSLLKGEIYFKTENGNVVLCDSEGDEIEDGEAWDLTSSTADGKTVYILTVKDTLIYELPNAGGMGIYWYTFSGMLLMMAGALMMYKKRRKEAL